MKLFQKLLLAPAALGLFAPMASNASEANLMDVSSYSQVDVVVNQDTFKPLSTKNPLLAGGEGLGQSQTLNNDFDVDSFSATTSASFYANWVAGAVDGTGRNESTGASMEKVTATWDWGATLTTSFDGTDSLDVELEAGQGGATLNEMDLNSNGTGITVASLAYTKSIGDYVTLYFADGGAGSALFNTACVYAGQTNVLDDCANNMTGMDLGLGTAIAASVDVGNGLAVSFGYEGEGNNADGLMTEQGVDAYAAQVSYIKDNYGVSYTFMHSENHTAADVGNATNSPAEARTAGETDYSAFNAFYQPDLDGFPSISVGLELAHDNSVADDTADETSHYFIGAQFNNLGNGTLGASVGSKTPTVENGDVETQWEAYYAYNYADGITITPVIYVKDNTAANTDDETGIVLKTSFEF